MKKIMFSGTLLVIAVLVSLNLVYGQPAGPPGGLDVKVVNDSTEPVPVTGEVTATVSGDVKVTNDEANAVPVTGLVEISAPPVTHMGQRAEDHVLLITGSGGSFTCPTGMLSAKRKFPNGDTPSGEFVVPEGRMLVLTDFAIGLREKEDHDWIEGNNLISVQLRIGLPEDNASESMWQTSIQIDGNMAISEEAWLKEELTSGVVIGPGQRVCIKAGFSFSASSNTVSLINLSKLNGYLVDN
jgi:hypothetical protein